MQFGVVRSDLRGLSHTNDSPLFYLAGPNPERAAVLEDRQVLRIHA